MKHKHDHNTGILQMDNFAQNSPLNIANPALKMVFSVTIICLTIAFDKVTLSIFVCISMIAMMRNLCKLSLFQITNLMKIPICFIVLSCITILVQISFLEQQNSIKLFGLYIYVTTSSGYQAISMFLKAYASICCLFFLSVSTTIERVIFVLNKWKCPSILIELMYLIYRYLFVLLDMQNKMSISARSRLSRVSYKRSWYAFSHIAGNVLINSFKRSSACFDAMESRLYDGKISFYTEEVKYSQKYLIYASIYVISVLIIGILG